MIKLPVLLDSLSHDLVCINM